MAPSRYAPKSNELAGSAPPLNKPNSRDTTLSSMDAVGPRAQATPLCAFNIGCSSQSSSGQNWVGTGEGTTLGADVGAIVGEALGRKNVDGAKVG
jgi:hypothetical protein